MAHSSLEKAQKEVPLTVEWRAFELRPVESRAATDEAALAEKKKQIEAYWPQVQSIAKEKYDLEMERGPWGIDTRLAHVGAKVARRLGREDEYHRKTFEAYWREGADISQLGTLQEIAEAAGIDPDEFAQGLKDETLVAEVLGEEMGAHRVGIQGVPATVIDNRYLISGAQPSETLVRVFKEYAEKGSINGR